MGSAGELCDVLDEDGRVVGVATRAEVRAGNLWHRTVFVAVVTPDDGIVVHRRADWKDVWPSFWDVCFGGVVGAGESWTAAAVRELAEEAGVPVAEADLEEVGQGVYEDDRVRERWRLFRVRADGPFRPADGEVAELDVVPLADLDTWITAHRLVPDTVESIVPLLR